MSAAEHDWTKDPPDLDDLLKPSKKTRDWLRLRIQHLRDKYPQLREHLTAKQLSRDLNGALDVGQVEEFLKGNHAPQEKAHQALVNHLWKNKWCGMTWLKEGLADQPGALFYALCNFLDTSEQRLIDLRKQAVGIYRTWRPSMHVEGKFTLGKMVISVDPASGGVVTSETQVYKGSGTTSDQKEVYEGFMIKKSNYLLMFERLFSHHKGAPRVTVFHNAFYKDGLVVTLEGAVTGCYGDNNLFSAPIYAERVENEAELDEQLDVYPTIPDLIKSKLVFHMRNDGVIRF